MTVDPFNGGPTDTLYSTPMPADQRRAALAVMRRFRGGPDMTTVLAALGLDAVAADMLNRRAGAKRLSVILTPDSLSASPVHQPAPAGPATDISAPQKLPPGARWCGRGEHILPRGGECPTCRDRRRRAKAAAKTNPTLAAEYLAQKRGDPTLCPKQLHPWVQENIILRNGGKVKSCRLCRNKSRRARKAVLLAERGK